MAKNIRVLIVDDATFMRKTIRKILETNKKITIVGAAKNGQEAIRMNKELCPDVITLDIDMPVMDGITALKHIMIERPAAVVIVSSLSYEAEVTFEAFRLGVVDFLPKPKGAISQELEKEKNKLCKIVQEAAQVDISKVSRATITDILNKDATSSIHETVAPEKVVIIAASHCEINSIIRILSKIPKKKNFAIIVMVNMNPKVMDSFIQKLKYICPFDVVRGEDHPIDKGKIYFYSSQNSYPLFLKENSQYFLKNSCQETQFPIDKCFDSAASVENLEILGVLFSGLGKDGLKGISKIHKNNGDAIIQSEVDAIFSEKTQIVASKKTKVLKNDEILEHILDFAQ